MSRPLRPPGPWPPGPRPSGPPRWTHWPSPPPPPYGYQPVPPPATPWTHAIFRLPPYGAHYPARYPKRHPPPRCPGYLPATTSITPVTSSTSLVTTASSPAVMAQAVSCVTTASSPAVTAQAVSCVTTASSPAVSAQAVSCVTTASSPAVSAQAVSCVTTASSPAVSAQAVSCVTTASSPAVSAQAVSCVTTVSSHAVTTQAASCIATSSASTATLSTPLTISLSTFVVSAPVKTTAVTSPPVFSKSPSLSTFASFSVTSAPVSSTSVVRSLSEAKAALASKEASNPKPVKNRKQPEKKPASSHRVLRSRKTRVMSPPVPQYDEAVTISSSDEDEVPKKSSRKKEDSDSEPFDFLLPPVEKPSTSGSSFDLNFERVLFHSQGQCDEKYVRKVLTSVFDNSKIHWSDICGLKEVKQRLKEMVVYPMLNPTLFKGLRSPAKGLLLYGPPGTGKTMIGKCLATEGRATFFSVTISTFGSKWYGEAESLAKALFVCARALQPSIIFIDEVDAVLHKPKEMDGSCVTRLKTELLSNMDGCTSKEEDRILVVGATNWPYQIDEAARRRFTKRLYVPLPDAEGRKEQLKRLLRGEPHNLTEKDLDKVVELSDGYSGSDIKGVCQDAAMAPIRMIDDSQVSVRLMSKDDLRPICLHDFEDSLTRVCKSVSPELLLGLEKFSQEYGSR